MNSFNKTSTAYSHALFTSLLFLVALVALTLGPLQGILTPAHAQTSQAERANTVAAAQKQKLVITSDPLGGNYRATNGRKIDTVVVHYMSGINVEPSRWADPKLNKSILKRYGVSAHYLVARDGKVIQLVNEKNVAYHAGGSIMPAPDNRKNVNSFSIGIETIATPKSGFTEAQYKSLALLISDIKSRHNIRHLVGHDEIAGLRAVKMGLRKDAKPDPGPLFDWQRLHSLLQDVS